MFEKLKLLFENIKENFADNAPDNLIEADAEFFNMENSNADNICVPVYLPNGQIGRYDCKY